MKNFSTAFLLLASMFASVTVCLGVGTSYGTTNYGNKIDYLEPKCMELLKSEMSVNISRAVSVLLTGHLADISIKAGELARSSIGDDGTFFGPQRIQNIVNQVGSYLSTSYKELEIGYIIKFSSKIGLQRLCHLFNCCYSP